MKIVELNDMTHEIVTDVPKNETLQSLFHLQRADKIVQVKVLEFKRIPNSKIEAAWKVDFNGILGLVTFAESGLDHINQMKQYVGLDIFVTIEKINTEPYNHVVASRSKAIQKTRSERLKQVKEGDKIIGVIQGIGKHVLYVDIGGGLVSKVKRVNATRSSSNRSLKKIFTIGQSIEVQILRIDRLTGDVESSHVLTLPSVWEMYKFKYDETLIAEVITISKSKSVFVEVKDGLDAILTLPAYPIDLNVGDKVQVSVSVFDSEKQKFRVKFNSKIN